MDIAVKPTKESEVEINIKASADDISSFIRDAAKKLSKDSPLKGFRPGNAPADVVAEAFGEERLMQEAMQKAVPHLFVQAVIDEGVEAIDQPKVVLNKSSRVEGLEFTATVSTVPDIKLGDIGSITITKKKISITDKDIERELAQLAKSRSTFIDVARPAQEGDTVKVDFTISINGTVIEGGEGKDQGVTIGEGFFVKDFEQKIQGMVEGDNREFEINFPEDYGHKKYAGKKAQAKVLAKAVQKRTLPELNDEFAKGLGSFESLADLKKKMKENLQLDREAREKERYQSEMTAELAKVAEIEDVPNVLIEKEIDRQLEEFNQMLSMQQKNIDDYMKSRDRNIDQIREEMREKAIENVKTGLAMRALIKQEGVEVTAEEIGEKLQEYMKQFPSAKDAEEKVDVEGLKDQIAGMLRNQKALEALEKKISIKEEVLDTKSKPKKVESTKKEN